MKKQKTAFIVLIAATFALLLCSTSAFAEPYSNSSSGSLSVSEEYGSLEIASTGNASSNGSTKYAPGNQLRLSGGGFKAGSKYSILWDGKVLIDPIIDNNGFASYTFSVPSNATAGIHTVGIQGTAGNGGSLLLTSNITVVASATTTTEPNKTDSQPATSINSNDEPAANTSQEASSGESASNSLISGLQSFASGLLPFTGGTMLLYLLAAGFALLVIGIAIRLVKKAR